ncbi:DUF6238 family protein [Streptomyces sp. NPDC088141]|uniref:DUF6238 family protein n=1 Tax=Streptomyces sp. NPDC088141 TaxID=3155179 RepID=UPI00341F6539
MTSSPTTGDAHPYLRAATAGIRHHARPLATAQEPAPAERPHLDALHAHLTALHQLLDHLAETTRPPYPATGHHLALAHTRIWQAAAAVHDGFHTLPLPEESSGGCRPDQLPEGPPVLTVCQRHVAAGHTIRRKTTARDLTTPLHGHSTICTV